MRQLPNLITLSRIAVLVALVWLVFLEWTGAATLAFFCILYGSISDFVDGYIARRYGFITNFGKIMDALVDKIMTLGAFVLLMVTGILGPAWLAGPLVGLMALREIGITLMRMVAARRNVVLAADKAGKRKTIWQVTAICVLFAVPMVEKDWSSWLGSELALFGNYVYMNGVLYFALAAWLTIASGAHYVKAYGPLVFSGNGDAGDA